MAGVAHPLIAGVAAAFNDVEKSYVDKVAAGHVADWSEYRLMVGKIEEVRSGRKRTVDFLTEQLKGEIDGD